MLLELELCALCDHLHNQSTLRQRFRSVHLGLVVPQFWSCILLSRVLLSLWLDSIVSTCIIILDASVGFNMVAHLKHHLIGFSLFIFNLAAHCVCSPQ